jgi:lactoylglutathione lyase
MEKGSKTEFKFDHVHIKCHDIKAVKRFYEEMFNAKTRYEGKARNIPTAMMEIDETVIIISAAGDEEVLESQKNPTENIYTRYGIGHIGLRVEDLDEVVRELRAKGAEFVWEPREVREGVRVAFVRAPENDVIEIIQRNK